MDEIYDNLANNENVILDTSNLSDSYKDELLKKIHDKGLESYVIVWP